MSVSADYLTYVTDQLSGFARIGTRRMFGAVGLYADDVFFGLIADDVLYLKVDDTNREDYVVRGGGPFRPYADEPGFSMSYFAVPAEVLEDADELKQWARKALEIAAGASLAKQRKRSSARAKRAKKK